MKQGCYASEFGFRCGSEIAMLIDFIRDEFRVKYGDDYILLRRCVRLRNLICS
jgi:hypothetical protein